MADANALDQLKADVRTVILQVKTLEYARLQAIATAQPAAAEGIRVQVVAVAQIYNQKIATLQAAEPSAGWMQLAHVDDLTIPNASGAQFDLVNGTGQATTSPGDRLAAGASIVAQKVENTVSDVTGALKGALGTVKILPYLAVGILLVALLYLYQKGKAL
jgi:hypothetical protein